MNRLELALFELRADVARNPGNLNDAELDGLLTGIAEESDANLRAAVEFFGLNLANIEERAAILQFDGGLARATANRLALTLELRRVMPDVSDGLCRWFARNSAAVMAYGRERGLSRAEIAGELMAYFRHETPAGAKHTEAIHGLAI